MSGINSLSGLNNISVDYRPTVELIKPKTNNSNQLLPGGDVAPQNVPQPPKAEAKSVVKEAGKVYGTNQWQDKTNLFMMTGVTQSVEIEKSDGTTITADSNLQHVRDFRTRDCPSLYKREKFDNMFIAFSEI